MLASSEQVVNYATDSIINKIDRSIASLEKVNKNKPVHSARQIFKVLGEISSHISYAADKQLRLTTPKDLNSLRLDSYMSVFNVEANQNPIRHRSMTKNYKKRRGTMEGRQQLFQSFKKKRTANYDKLQALKPEDSQLQRKRSQNQLAQQELQDKFRAEMQKKILKTPDVKKKTMPKIVPVQQLKQKFSYDYDSNRIKIKSEIRSSLVHSNRSLKAEISRNVQIKPSLHKMIKPVPTVLKTNLVVEKKKKEKKGRQNTEEPLVQQPVQIQFSKVNSLNQMLQCQPGVRFNFNGHTFKSSRSQTQPDSHQNGDNTVIRYSKLDYMLLKKRRSTSLNNLQMITNRSVNKKSSAAQTELEYSQSYHNLTINTQRSSDRQKHERVSVSNEKMLQYLLTPEMRQKEQKIVQLEREEEQVSTNIKLDENDRYNMNYIRGMRNLSINTSQKDFEKKKFPNHQPLKIPFLKVRQRLQNKMIFISQLKKKFEQTLRTSQQGSNLLEN